MLTVRDLTIRYGDLTIVDQVSFQVAEGQWLMLAGPNGAGKSTIVNAIAQGAPYQGSISFQGRDIARLRGVERARCFGVLSQAHQTGYAFTVDELVRLGRYCHAPRLLQPKSRADQDMVEQALSLTGMTALRYHTLTTLSGGELQRAFLAQLFAQDPPLLILDEPTNHLDLMYQSQIFQLLRDWLAQGGRAVISVVHDLSLARAYGSQGLLLDKGRLVAAGPVRETLNREQLRRVYGLDVYQWMRQMLQQWED